MKILHIDWAVFLDFMEPWRGLSPAARMLLLDAKPRAVLPRKATAPELPRLLEGGFLTEMTDGVRIQVASAFHETHKVLRSFARHPVLVQPDARTLRMYMGDHFTNEERRALDKSGRLGWDHDALLIEAVTSVGHARGFLRSEDPRAWEKGRLPEPGWSGEQAWTQSKPLFTGKHAAADLVRLIETLSATTEPVPFHTLAERIGSPSPARLGNALEAGLRYLLCFPGLDAEFVPVLALWPDVAARLSRTPAPPPEHVVPEESLCMAFRMEDLTQLLVRAAEPMRVKANGYTLFVAVERELERGLLPLPAWLTHPRLFPENAPGERVREALHLARSLGFMDESDTPGRERALQATPAGWEWLDASPHERLRVLLDLLRPRLEEARAQEGGQGQDGPPGARDEVLAELAELEEALDGALDPLDDEFDDGFDDELVPFGSDHALRSKALSDATLFGPSLGKGLVRDAIEAYATLEPGRPVLLNAFLGHHAEASNPLLALEQPVHRGFGGYGRPVTEEALEELWSHALQRILHVYLLPHGGVGVGIVNPGGLTIELTSVGRYLLGLTSAFTLDAPAPARTPVRVQPDFEVVFVAASPALEAAISRFAERRGTGVGVLFRITRESILLAAQSGLAADEVLATLAGACTTPVPANVAHEIRAWFGACRRLRIEPVHLVRCPDAATALRVLTAAGAGKLEALSETVLALTAPAHKAAVVRACRKAGLFLASATGEATGPSPRRKRRTRWR